MKKQFLIATLMSVFAFSAQAQNYEIDPHHTFVHFKYNHLGFSTQMHKFEESKGTVFYDGKNVKVDVNIQINSVDTGSDLFDDHLMAEDFFNEKKYPFANFKASELEFEGNQPKRLHGDLTIKGITKHVTMDIISLKNAPHPMTKKQALGVDGKIMIKRSDFGLGQYAPAVSDEVEIHISFEGQVK